MRHKLSPRPLMAPGSRDFSPANIIGMMDIEWDDREKVHITLYIHSEYADLIDPEGLELIYHPIPAIPKIDLEKLFADESHIVRGEN